MSSILKNLMNFSLFVNVFIFTLSLFCQKDLENVRIYFAFGSVTIDFTINFYLLIVGLASILVLGAMSGVQAFGSGLNDSSTQMVLKVVAFISLWFILSLFTLSFLNPLQVIGNIIWLTLTIFYGIGFLSKVTDVED